MGVEAPWCRWILGGIALVLCTSCGVPSDDLFEPVAVEAVEVEPGLHRLTFNTGPDIVRGFDADGSRVVYRSRAPDAAGSDWRLYTVPRDGGVIEEVAGLYRRALRVPPGTISLEEARRVFTAWRTATEGAEVCRGCPAPAVVGITIIRLDATDGRALSSLPAWSPGVATFEPTPMPSLRRVRLTPADTEVQTFGTNPYGPAIAAGRDTAYYSDGEAVWRFDLERPSVPVESIVEGAFPSLSGDGRRIAIAVPDISDSAVVLCGAQACTQETVSFSVDAWRVHVLDLSTGATVDLGLGVEPHFHQTDRRLLVRRLDGLHWINLDDGSSQFIPETSGAFAAAVSPDGSRLAFSSTTFGNPDVFVLMLR